MAVPLVIIHMKLKAFLCTPSHHCGPFPRSHPVAAETDRESRCLGFTWAGRRSRRRRAGFATWPHQPPTSASETLQPRRRQHPPPHMEAIGKLTALKELDCPARCGTSADSRTDYSDSAAYLNGLKTLKKLTSASLSSSASTSTTKASTISGPGPDARGAGRSPRRSRARDCGTSPISVRSTSLELRRRRGHGG
jgi:hypothetical protein